MNTDTLADRIFACIDHTTLNATDNEATVEAFCLKALNYSNNQTPMHSSASHVAAVCVYPRFVGVAARVLRGSGIHVASVAGAFPHGQLPLQLKVAEVEYAIAEGADEVDIVLNRGLLLAGNEEAVVSEVAAMRDACKGKLLKVILETGELPTPALIRRASELAIAGGADFIKTSTGKISTGATLEAAEVMLRVIATHHEATRQRVGFKAAGGIRVHSEALQYARLAQKIMGDDYLQKTTFRIGASSLTEKFFSIIN